MATIKEQAAAIKGYAAEIDAAIVAKGGTTIGGLRNAAAAIESLPCGETPIAERGDVNFFLPDGRLVRSFSSSEFISALDDVTSLEALVPMPVMVGLKAESWNWTDTTWAQTKANLTNQLNSRGRCDIGGVYTTDNGETRLYINIADDARLLQPLNFGRDGGESVTVDWGDGSTDEYSHEAPEVVTHTYTVRGEYVIRLRANSGGILVLYGSGSAHTNVFGLYDTTETNPGRVYCSRLHRVELGDNVKVDQYAFNAFRCLETAIISRGVVGIGINAFSGCQTLKAMIIPNRYTKISDAMVSYSYRLSVVSIPYSVVEIGNRAFGGCQGLSNVVIPNSVKVLTGNAFNSCTSLNAIDIPDGVGGSPLVSNRAIQGNTFYNCESLSRVYLPDGIERIYSGAFSGTVALSSVRLPATINYIDANAFKGCLSVVYFDFSHHQTVPNLTNISAFDGVAVGCKIVVPDALYDDWIVSTNWINESIRSKIIKASEYFGG